MEYYRDHLALLNNQITTKLLASMRVANAITQSILDDHNGCTKKNRAFFSNILFLLVCYLMPVIVNSDVSFTDSYHDQNSGSSTDSKNGEHFHSHHHRKCNHIIEYIDNPSHSSDISFIYNVERIVKPALHIIPLLSVFVRSGTAYLERFFYSIDYHVDTLLIVQDGIDSSNSSISDLVHSFCKVKNHNQSVYEKVWDEETLRLHNNNASHSSSQYRNPFVHHVRYVINRQSTGCAQAWNTVYRLYPNQPFWLKSANDILLLPNALKSFYLETWKLARSDPDVGMTSAAIDFGSSAGIRKTFGLMLWSTTRQGVLSVGMYDENFYPAYFEDEDIVWRHYIANKKFVVFQDIVVKHGDGDGYHSGSIREDKSGKLKKIVNRSMNEKYLKFKWGPGYTGINYYTLEKAEFNITFRANCKAKSPSVYCSPFRINNDFLSLYYKESVTTLPNIVGFWDFNKNMRECVRDFKEESCDHYLVFDPSDAVSERTQKLKLL